VCASRRRSRRPILAEFVQGWSSDLRPLGHHLIKGHCQFCEFVAVTQAMQPLLGEAPAARIVNVSSGVGSLTRNSDSTYAYHSAFGPVYPASKTALNAITLAMAIELESIRIKVNAVSPRFTKTNFNLAGTETVEEDAREAVPRCAARTRWSGRDVHALGKRNNPLMMSSCSRIGRDRHHKARQSLYR